MTYVEVLLEQSEATLAAMVGVQRQMQAIREGRPDRYGADSEAGWSLHIEGAAGEMAFAKAIGMYWQAPVGTFQQGGDVGNIQVRTRSSHNYELIIRPGDRPDDIFVLVTGKCPVFRVHGFTYARAVANHPEWLKDHGNRAPAHFVPQDALIPIGVLPVLLNEQKGSAA